MIINTILLLGIGIVLIVIVVLIVLLLIKKNQIATKQLERLNEEQ